MNKTNIKLLAVVVSLIGFQIGVKAQEMSVFGMKLGESFTVPECSLVLEEKDLNQYFRKKSKEKYWQYEYDMSSPTSQCFKRPDIKDIKFNKKEEISPLPLPKPKALVKVLSPAGAKPALSADGILYAFLLSDGNLDSVSFLFNKNEADEVFIALKKKYGDAVKITPMKWQNRLGAVYEYYIADWTLPQIKVKFQSAGTFFTGALLGLDPADPLTRIASESANNAFDSPYGMVSIGRRGKEVPLPGKIPL